MNKERSQSHSTTKFSVIVLYTSMNTIIFHCSEKYLRTLQRFISLSHPVNWVSFAHRREGIAGQRQRVVGCQECAGKSLNSRLWNFYFKYFKSPLRHPGEKSWMRFTILLLLYNYSNTEGFRIVFTSEKTRNHHKRQNIIQ